MSFHYTTDKGLEITYQDEGVDYLDATVPLLAQLDSHLGALFTSSFEYPGRYTCWDIGFVKPPLMISSIERTVWLKALNKRGSLLLSFLHPYLKEQTFIEKIDYQKEQIVITIVKTFDAFTEEERSRKPSVFSLLRAIRTFFFYADELYLGLYGAYGYDLVFQFENMPQKLKRDKAQREMVLFLVDELYVVDHRKETAFIRRYDFSFRGCSTKGSLREGETKPYQFKTGLNSYSDHQKGEYEKTVLKAKEKFKCGDLFEVVPGQTFYEPCEESPSVIFKRLRERNPAPYGFMINLGEQEYLVGASPEMYVRVQGRRVETSPISGTIKRGANALLDAKNIEKLLASEKECAELTMCTDVDRNDKSRVCEAGSVQIIGRRLIEMYSRLIHTVDHVEGILREEFDAIDAFLSHMWVVTVTGAPKVWAMQFIEQHEKTPRKWYAGSVGWFNFNGNMNTGLVLRTLRIKKGLAEIRAGATLLFDSVPALEEAETRLKASAFIDVIREKKTTQLKPYVPSAIAKGKTILLIDHEDSFVHTLANYFRQTGALVITVRFHLAKGSIVRHQPHLVVLSPGPGKPQDFNVADTIECAIENQCAIFGVCLGLQAIVEYFGGKLNELEYPMHGKASIVKVIGGHLFKNLPSEFEVGRYHSLYADEQTLPSELTMTAKSEDGIIMAVEHKTKCIKAVQFHPEALLSLKDEVGLKLIVEVVRQLNTA